MKRSIRFLSLFLSALLLLQALGLSAFALDLEISYSNVDFNELNAGDALKTGTKIARVPTYAQVCERADGDLYAAVPFKGKVSDRSTYEGNPDTSIYAKNTATSWEDGALILSIDYYLHYVDLAAEDCGYSYTANREDPTVECQFSSITHGADDTKVSFISLFIINVRTGALTYTGTPVANAGVLKQDAWNTVKLIIDPVTGTYKTYLNGSLHSTKGYISRGNDDAGITHMDVPASSLIALKCNKNVGAYNASAEYADITTVGIDNISFKKYTETVSVTLDGEEIDVTKDTALTLAKEGCTLDYAIVTPEDGEPYIVTTTAIDVEEGMTIECHWLEGEYFGYQSFDRLTTGVALGKNDGFSAVPAISEIQSEGEGVYANGYVHVPFVGDEAAGNSSNWDKSIQINHAALTSGESFTLEASYRPHFTSTTNANPTVEAQMYQYSFVTPEGTLKTGGVYLNLYVIDLATGIIKGCGKVVENAPRMKADEWNEVKLVFYPQSASFKLYLNGELYSVQEELTCVIFSPVKEVYEGGCTDISIAANQFIVAKCNKNAGAYVSADNAANASYVDVDNIRVYATPKVEITVDGEKQTVGDGQNYVLTEENEQLLWADVTVDGVTERIYENSITATAGMTVETVKISMQPASAAELRLNGPDGVRFVTVLDRAQTDALLANDEVKSVSIGTLIVPTLSLASLTSYTKESLLSQGIAHMDVAGTVGAWYAQSAEEYRFAGSIAYVKEKNYNLSLSSVGYMTVETTDGKTYTVYAETDMGSIKDTTIAGEAKMMIEGATLTDAQKAWIEPIANAFVGNMLELYRKDLNGLNVLAFGDSLFGGTIGYDQSTQWVNKLGNDCGWNLTNLGIGSMTVSLTKYNNDPDHGNKDSMYDWLFNGKNDFRWGSTSKHTSPNPFYQCGDISGDSNDVELIIFEGGCNDYGTAISAPLGTVDSRDPGTFLGAWNLITERLLEQYPNATIVFLTSWRLNPQPRENDTITSIEFSESVITLYEEKYADNDRIALINAGDPAVSGVDMRNTEWRTEYSTDSYHLKDTGMAVMADNMLPLLWNIVREKRAADEQ